MQLKVLSDTYIDQNTPNTNYSSSSTLLTSIYNSTSSTPERQILIKFPACGYIKSLHIFSITNRSIAGIKLCKIISDWDANTVTWNSRPSIDSTAIFSFYNATGLPGNQWYNFTIEKSCSDLSYGVAILTTGFVGAGVVNMHMDFSSTESSLNTPYITIAPTATLLLSDTYGIFNSDKASTLYNLDFSQIVAGASSDIKPITIYNDTQFSVSNVIIWTESIPNGDIVEISKTNNPFIPSLEVHFDGVFTPDSSIGTFYVRIRPGENSSGSRSFRIKAKATPV